MVRFLFLVGSLLAGALAGWLSILGGIWFVMPIFLICGAILCVALDKVMRWRWLAFSIGMFAMFAVKASEFVTGVNEQNAISAKQEKKWKDKTPKPLQR